MIISKETTATYFKNSGVVKLSGTTLHEEANQHQYQRIFVCTDIIHFGKHIVYKTQNP